MSHNSRNPNVKPAYGYTLQQNMKAFDALPKAVRQALRDSDNNWSASAIKSGMRRFKSRSAAIVQLIKSRDEDTRVTLAHLG